MQPLNQMLSPMIANREIISQNLSPQEKQLFEKIRKQKFEVVSKKIKPSEVDSVRPEIVESWLRSHASGIDIYDAHAPVMGSNAFQQLLSEKTFLLQVADAYIEKLAAILFNTRAAIILSDEEGVILRLVIPWADARNGLRPGVIWNEKTIGTCSHGMCIWLKSPIQMCGPEHYLESFGQVAASSVPIFDINNNLTGSLSIAALDSHFQNPHTLGLAISMAWAIQNDFQVAEKNRMLDATMEAAEEAVLTINKQGIITGANMEARKMFPHNELLGESYFSNHPLIKSVLETGKPVLDAEISFDKFNQNLHLRSAKPVQDYYGKIIGSVLTFRKNNRVRKTVNRDSDSETRFTFDNIIGSSPQIVKTINLAKKFAPLGSNILIQGESGTGKEVYAQAIHNYSRPEGRYVAVNCAAIPKTLIESELFGYEGGAFTGAERQGKPGKIELANGGTLFLDEVGDMPLELQPVLLRVLEEKKVMRVGGSRYIPVDFKLIAASNQDLLNLVKNNQFRQDLYYRLAVFKAYIPPLRERGADVIRLAKYFIRNVAEEQQIPVPILSDAVELQLLKYDWPGNVRQLQNAMFYAVNMSSEGIIQPEDLPDEISGLAAASDQYQDIITAGLADNKNADSNLSIKDMERIAIVQALYQTGNNVCEAASILGLSRTTMYRKIKDYKINNN